VNDTIQLNDAVEELLFEPAQRQPIGRPADRRLRLAACGCCRFAWGQLAPECRRTVEVAERFADGRATVDELEKACHACRRAERWEYESAGGYRQTEHVHRVAAPEVTWEDVERVAWGLRPWQGESLINRATEQGCADVFRDVLGGIEQPLPLILSRWRTPDVLSLARTVYAWRDFILMPLLGDALRAAGVEDPAILGHCRQGTPHYRGCWVLDLLVDGDLPSILT
jgi:hypothetical protein